MNLQMKLPKMKMKFTAALTFVLILVVVSEIWVLYQDFYLRFQHRTDVVTPPASSTLLRIDFSAANAAKSWLKTRQASNPAPSNFPTGAGPSNPFAEYK